MKCKLIVSCLWYFIINQPCIGLHIFSYLCKSRPDPESEETTWGSFWPISTEFTAGFSGMYYATVLFSKNIYMDKSGQERI